MNKDDSTTPTVDVGIKYELPPGPSWATRRVWAQERQAYEFTAEFDLVSAHQDDEVDLDTLIYTPGEIGLSLYGDGVDLTDLTILDAMRVGASIKSALNAIAKAVES